MTSPHKIQEKFSLAAGTAVRPVYTGSVCRLLTDILARILARKSAPRACRSSRQTSRRGLSCVSGSWQAKQGSRPTRRHPCDYPRAEVGEDVSVGVRVRVGVEECQLYSMGSTPTPTRMRLSCNFVNVYTIAYRVQYTFTRVYTRIPNGQPREDPRKEKRAARVSVESADKSARTVVRVRGS